MLVSCRSTSRLEVPDGSNRRERPRHPGGSIRGRGWVRCIVFGLLALALAFPTAPANAQCEGETLVASDSAGGARFGRRLAADGELLVVGAPFDPTIANRAGAAYVFRLEADRSWTEEAKLTATDADPDDGLGISVAIDGDAAIVGAIEDDEGALQGGAAYVFRRDGGGAWTQEVKLLAPDAELTDQFGASVAIQGDIAFVGAPYEDSSGADSGSVYIFRHEGAGTWSFVTKLVAASAQGGALFGTTIAVEGDALLIGAPTRSVAASASGAVHAFRFDGSQWTEEALLSDPNATNAQFFGTAIDVENDIAVVGASLDNTDGNQGGSAFVFARAGGGVWHLAKQLGDGERRTQFGAGVAIEDGHLAIGAYRAKPGGIEAGAAFYFRSDGLGDWIPFGRYAAAAGANNDNLGFAVELHDGILLAGARLAETPGGMDAGSVVPFDVGNAACLCMTGTVDLAGAGPVDRLYVNGSAGGDQRTVTMDATDLLVAYLLLPPAGGNGKFVAHANTGAPTLDSLRILPSSVGTSCFEMLLPLGGAPIAVWNNVGRPNQVGASRDFTGSAIPDPPRAPSIFLQLDAGDPANLPPGTTITLQAAMLDPGSVSDKGGSVTNAVAIVFE